MKRVKKSKCANPLFEQWLDEWRQEALARDSPIVNSFRKALASLRKYPLPLATGRDCQILQNFGNKLCSMLDKKLEQYKLNKLPDSCDVDSTDSNDEVLKKKRKIDKNNKKDLEIKSNDSEVVNVEAVVISDDDKDNNSNVFDKKIQRVENVLSHSSLMKRTDSTDSSSSVEAFDKFCKENAESTVNVPKKSQHFIFTKSSSVEPVCLIDSQQEIQTSSTLKKNNSNEFEKKKDNDKKGTNQKKTKNSQDISYDPFYLLPNNFDVVLLVDTQETSGGKTNPQNDKTISELGETGILFEVRSLKIGDFTWIARCRFTQKELVLPYIVERKRIDDLSSSIIDGRYKEQKFRLKQSGIKNVIYIVENYGKGYYGSIPLSSLHQASVNSLIHDDFNVKYTQNHKDSMQYLATMTNVITKIFESRELQSCKKSILDDKDFDVTGYSNVSLMEFTEFNKSAKKSKNFKVQEMFMKQLLQLKGVSVDKAIAITNLYPTPKVLAEAFKISDENLLAKVTFGASLKKIGPVISKTLYLYYTTHTFN